MKMKMEGAVVSDNLRFDRVNARPKSASFHLPRDSGAAAECLVLETLLV
jgi:hypothetical protein